MTADCKHTAHYPGIEPTLQIERKYPLHHGSMLWWNTDSLAQTDFSLDFESYILTNVYIERENYFKKKGTLTLAKSSYFWKYVN